jgi:hypothetical protein
MIPLMVAVLGAAGLAIGSSMVMTHASRRSAVANMLIGAGLVLAGFALLAVVVSLVTITAFPD